MEPKNCYLFISILFAGILGYDSASVFAGVDSVGNPQKQLWEFQVRGQTGAPWTTATDQEDLCGHKLKISEDDFANFVHFLTNLKADSVVIINKVQPHAPSAIEKSKTFQKFDERQYEVKIIQCQVWSKHKDERTGNESLGLEQGVAHDILMQKITDCKSIININFLSGSSGGNAELKFTVVDPVNPALQYNVHIILQPK